MADVTQTAADVLNVDCPSETGIAGVSITAGQWLYLDSATTKMKLAKAGGTAAEAAVKGMALHASLLDQPITFSRLKGGSINPGATLAVGTTYYLSGTAGAMVPDSDSFVAGWYKIRLGYATAANRLVMESDNYGQNPTLASLGTLLRAWDVDDLVLANDDPVATWAGAFGSATAATQATSGFRPLYKTAIQNGPVVRFDGTDDYLGFTATSALTAFHLFFAGSLSTLSGNHTYLGGSIGGLYSDVSTSENALDDALVSANLVHGGTAKTTAFRVYEFEYDGATVTFRQNGTVLDDASATGAFTFDKMCALSSGSHCWIGDVGRLQLYSAPLSSGNATVARSSAMWRFAL